MSSSSLPGSRPGGGPPVSPEARRSLAPRCVPPWVASPRSLHPGSAATGPGPLGRGLLVSRGGLPQGGSVELPGTAGTRPDLESGPPLLPPGGLGPPRWPLAGPPNDGGPRTRGWRPAPAPGSSQRWMWPLGSPEGSSSFLAFRARERAGFVWGVDCPGSGGLPSRLSLGGWVSLSRRGPSPSP